MMSFDCQNNIGVILNTSTPEMKMEVNAPIQWSQMKSMMSWQMLKKRILSWRRSAEVKLIETELTDIIFGEWM